MYNVNVHLHNMYNHVLYIILYLNMYQALLLLLVVCIIIYKNLINFQFITHYIIVQAQMTRTMLQYCMRRVF